jgi:hypothetical protein
MQVKVLRFLVINDSRLQGLKNVSGLQDYEASLIL